MQNSSIREVHKSIIVQVQKSGISEVQKSGIRDVQKAGNSKVQNSRIVQVQKSGIRKMQISGTIELQKLGIWEMQKHSVWEMQIYCASKMHKRGDIDSYKGGTETFEEIMQEGSEFKELQKYMYGSCIDSYKSIARNCSDQLAAFHPLNNLDSRISFKKTMKIRFSVTSRGTWEEVFLKSSLTGNTQGSPPPPIL